MLRQYELLKKEGKKACESCPVMDKLSKKERKKLRRDFRKKKKKKRSDS